MKLSGVTEHPAVRAAARAVRDGDERTLENQVELTQIPAPPFAEDARGERVAELFREAGLDAVRRDAVGNVLADLPSSTEAGPATPPLVVSAHLDTVFPAGTDVTVRSEGERWLGPGISDDGRGLAALVALARCLVTARVPLSRPLLFMATVGEEGIGDLRGVKHFFRHGEGSQAPRGFVSLDGAGLKRIVVRGLGARRLRMTVRGPGGHSWADWGTPNPAHAIGVAVAGLERMPLPTAPTATVTAARLGGGTSINAIPGEAWVDLDLRCESPTVLGETVEQVGEIFRKAVAAVNGRADGGSGKLTLEEVVLGDRPPGDTDPEEPLVQAALEATRALGCEPELVSSSTDANIAMARGIPALTMGAGGKAGQAHTTDEWYSNEQGPDGIVRALYTVVLEAGVEDV